MKTFQSRAEGRRMALPFTAASAALLGLLAFSGCGGSDSSGSGSNSGGAGLPSGKATPAQVVQGRALVVASGCIDCHNRGKNDPSDPKWLAGYLPGTPDQPFQIGPFQTYPANLTPDGTTGLGQYTDRQVYNALKHGLDPGATPDTAITGDTPGAGGFPTQPHYLAPPMPWTSTRHLSDDDLCAITAYLKHGIKPIANAVPDSQGPPDFWAGSDTPDKIGPATLAPYPSGSEQFMP